MGNRIPSLMAMLAIGLAEAQVGLLAAQTFKILHSFTPLGDYRSGFGTNSDGAGPWGGLTLLGNTLYGVAAEGGTWGNGTVFKVNTDGTGFAPLYSFSTAEGAHPVSALVASGNTLYGTAQLGGTSNNGMLFAINTDGTGFTQLHSFAAASAWPCPCVNGDGAGPYAGLALLGDRLYGATIGGGSLGGGTVFSVNLDGTRFTTLHSFSQADLPLYAHPPLR